MNQAKKRWTHRAFPLRGAQACALVCLLVASAQPAAAERLSPALGHSARQLVRPASQPGRLGGKLQRGAHQLQQKLIQSKAGHALLAAKATCDQCLGRTRARMTLTADHLQARLPGPLSPLYGKARRLSLPSVPTFAAHQFKKDPAFYTSYAVLSGCVTNLAMPAALLSLGISAPLIATLRAIVGTPVDLAVVALRTHARRADRAQSFWGSMKQLTRDFIDFGEQRRQENRALDRALRLE